MLCVTSSFGHQRAALLCTLVPHIMAAERPPGVSETTWRRLVHYGVPMVVLMMIAHIQNASPVDRDLDAVELFCGCGQLTAQFQAQGLQCVGYDLKNGPGDNIMCVPGLMRALQLVLRLKIGSFCGLARPAVHGSGFLVARRGGQPRTLWGAKGCRAWTWQTPWWRAQRFSFLSP
jgi:hypothetical protein